MYTKLIFILIMLLPGIMFAQETVTLSKTSDSVSYALAVNIATNIKKQGIKGFDRAIFNKAFEDVLNGNTLAIDASLADAILRDYFTKEKSMTAQKNLEEGQKFLEENGKKDGVITLESGLQYIVIKEGTGNVPQLTDTVKTHYSGMLIDGTKFDSSYDRGEPISFPVTGVIKGWTEALLLMKEGAKWKLFIPADLAYGARGAGGVIPPNAALIFDIELLSIEKK